MSASSPNFENAFWFPKTFKYAHPNSKRATGALSTNVFIGEVKEREKGYKRPVRDILEEEREGVVWLEAEGALLDLS